MLIQEKSDNLVNGLKKCTLVLNDVNDDREFIYNMYEEDTGILQRQLVKNTKKSKIKIILISTGTSLVGIGVGILVGALIIN
jgi:hypothetical protein